MKKLIVFTAALIFGVTYTSCEKDDICSQTTPTTPSMVVEFFSAENRSINKPVTNLKYFVEGRTDTITISGNTTEIRVPLRTDTTNTKWGFIYSFTPTGAPAPILNTDFIEFKYTTIQTFISRACGFKSTFLLDPGTNPNPNPVLTDVAGESNLWIQDIDVEKNNIDDENETHISIYF